MGLVLKLLIFNDVKYCLILKYYLTVELTLNTFIV